MNLHGIVRGAITSVNPDMTGIWRQSAGATIATGGRTSPNYIDHEDMRFQVQALSGRDLQHANFLSMQGVKRSVYMFSDAQGVNRPNAEGGDLLIFPEHVGGPPRVWLVAQVFETWTPDATGFCKVGVVLQTDEAGT